MSDCPVVFRSTFFTVKRHHFNRLCNQKTAVELSFLSKKRSISKVKEVIILALFWAKGLESVEDGVRTGQ